MRARIWVAMILWVCLDSSLVLADEAAENPKIAAAAQSCWRRSIPEITRRVGRKRPPIFGEH
jgi:hypothetical protein